MISSRDIFAIKKYLENEGIIQPFEILVQNNRKEFTFSEHIRGMVYSFLSAQTVWNTIESKMKVIDEIFFHFDIQKIKSTEYMYFYDKLRDIKAHARFTKKQLSVLHHNIGVMESINSEYDSMDSYLLSKPVNVIISELSNSTSKRKLKMIGVALCCEYLKNVGIDCFKPDVHIKRMFSSSRLGDSNKSKPNYSDLCVIFKKLSDETGLLTSQLDNILWNYCATGKAEICTATPNCHKCVIKESCKYR